ncbi:hypothetical protein FQ087_02970 [Sporosarcina sp. ANT_H38]|uniref:hypothetical protein n=1 Tax=Sporosarcina sp. ANT_H38 TaxID=2597358 RepID=UPI0011F2AAEB|nr:hypothetical protein [Sporosarcina sp. ANT_H38]KAA0965286.1 hypothetical protein FQ087_02970 [Sporosarcina sp. ANT_H38]
MYWDYRVVEDKYPKSSKSCFGICEVHYDENHVPHIWGEIMPAESLDELKDDYEYMRKAFESPVLKVVDGKLVEVTE